MTHAERILLPPSDRDATQCNAACTLRDVRPPGSRTENPTSPAASQPSGVGLGWVGLDCATIAITIHNARPRTEGIAPINLWCNKGMQCKTRDRCGFVITIPAGQALETIIVQKMKRVKLVTQLVLCFLYNAQTNQYNMLK